MPSKQLTQVEVSQMTPDEISRALRAGELAELLGAEVEGDEQEPEPAPPGSADLGARAPSGMLGDIRDAAELRGMTPEQIEVAHRAGRLDDLLGRTR